MSKVIIKHNPHHAGAEGIIGTLVGIRKGEGFMRCDIYDVQYTHPETGERGTMPFSAGNLILSGDKEAVLAMAERHEEQARLLRAFVEGE